jgi:hypothetical protein
MSHLVHGILESRHFRYDLSFLTSTIMPDKYMYAGDFESFFTHVHSSPANRQTDRRSAPIMLARTFYHDVWDPPGNKTISPGWSRARIVAAGVIFHASGEDVRVLITCVSEMSMSLPVRVACC